MEGQIAGADGFVVLATAVMLMPLDKDEFDRLKTYLNLSPGNAKSRTPCGARDFNSLRKEPLIRRRVL